MKLVILLSVLALVAAAEETYTTENDDLDIEAVVASEDKLKSFFNCFVDTGSCDAVQADFKKDIPEVVATACAKCTEAQKHIFKRYLEVLQQKLPNEYQAFRVKYDPENKLFAALESAIAQA